MLCRGLTACVSAHEQSIYDYRTDKSRDSMSHERIAAPEGHMGKEATRSSEIKFNQSIIPKGSSASCPVKGPSPGFVKTSRSRCSRGHDLSVASSRGSSLQDISTCSGNRPRHMERRGQINVNITARGQTLVVFIGGAQDLRMKVADVDPKFYVQLTLMTDVKAVPVVCVSQTVPLRSSIVDETFDISVPGASKHQRLLVEVIQAVPDGRNERIGSMSFGVRHLLSGRRAVNDWFYLLNENLGRHKHFRVGRQQGRERPACKSASTSALDDSTEHIESAQFQSTPVITHASYTSKKERRSPGCNDLSCISVCSRRDKAFRPVDELDLLNISGDEDLAPGPSPSSYVAGPHNTSHKVSPRSHIRHLLDQADLAHSSFFTTTAFFSESMEELRGGDTPRPRLVSWDSDHVVSSGDFQTLLFNPGLSVKSSPSRDFLVDNLRGLKSSRKCHLTAPRVSFITLYA